MCNCHRATLVREAWKVVRWATCRPGRTRRNPVSWSDLPPALSRTLRIDPPTSWQFLNLRELWEYRELLFFFVWRDIKVRYKQTVLGALWAVIQPVATTVLFTIFFGRLAGMSKQVNGPYALHVFVGLLPWTLFTNAVTLAGTSMVGSSHLISKVYFPRLLVPAASVVSGLVDFAISFLVLLALMAWYGVAPTPQIFTLPLFIAGALASATGAGVMLAALTVTYRDFRYAIGFMMQLWMFATPVLYPIEIIPPEWRMLYALNPMVGVITGFRTAVLGGPFAIDLILVSAVVSLVLLAIGVSYFLQVERRFADII
jgi:lipopolysaccharide transport system permease protein